MRVSIQDERKLTELDFARLKRFTAGGAVPRLAELLDDADVVAPQAIPGDVVTMYARVVVFDSAIQRRRILIVCYPKDADPAKGLISVLSPMGLGLLGLPVGAKGVCTGPDGQQRVVTIEAILFQPEAAGDYLV